MRFVKKITSIALVAALTLTSAVPAGAEKGYDANNKDKWEGLKIDTSEVPTPDNKDIFFDNDKNIVCNTNVRFQLDAVVDSTWSVSPANKGVEVDASGMVVVAADAQKDTTYTVTADPENITSKGDNASIKVRIPKDAIAAEATDICYADTMEAEGVTALSADKKTLTVTGARKLPLETVVTPAYIADQSVKYEAQNQATAIGVSGETLTTNEITGSDNKINCTIGEATETKSLFVKVVKNPLSIKLANDDVAIDPVDRDVKMSMDQRATFYIDQNSAVALEENGTIKLSDYKFDISGDNVEADASGNGYTIYDETGKSEIGTITIKGTGATLKAVVETNQYDKSWTSAKDVTIKMSYKRKDTKSDEPADSFDSVKIKFMAQDAKFNTVGLDFAKGGLLEDVDFAVYNEDVKFSDGDATVQKNMPVYYFEANGDSLPLAQFTFANGDYNSTVNSFNTDKDGGFNRDAKDTNYDITFKLTDVDVIDSKQNKEIGVDGEDVNKQKLLTYTGAGNKTYYDRLLLKGTGYKLLTVSYNDKKEYYVIRFVSPSDNIKDRLSLAKNSREDYDLSIETVHIRKGEAVVPEFKDAAGQTKNATLNDPFLTYTVRDTNAKAFTDGSGVYQVGGSAAGKTLVTVQGKVNKTDEVTYVLYVNNDTYEYDEGTFAIDFQAAYDQKLMDSSDAINGKQEAVPVNISVKKAGASIPEITWELAVRGDDETFTAIDPSFVEIKAGEEEGSAVITTKLSSNAKIYVRALSGDTVLAQRYFTIKEVYANKVSEIAEKVADGATAVVKSDEKNKGICPAGSEFTLAPVAYDPVNATALSGDISWSVENTDVATIDAKGTVNALAAGTTKIFAKYIVNGEENISEYTLTVEQADIAVTAIKCASEITLTRVGATETINAVVEPANATNKTLVYDITSGQDVISVSATGVVTAKKAGTATIKVSPVGNSLVAVTINVTVKGENDKPVASPSAQPLQTSQNTITPQPTASANTSATLQKPAKVKVSSVKNVKGKKVTVTFKKAANATSYQISYSLKKNFKGAKTVKTTKTSYTIKKLKKGKTYYIRVRACNTAGKGAYSAVKKVKIKK